MPRHDAQEQDEEQWQHSRPNPLPYFPCASNLPAEGGVDEHDLAAKLKIIIEPQVP